MKLEEIQAVIDSAQGSGYRSASGLRTGAYAGGVRRKRP